MRAGKNIRGVVLTTATCSHERQFWSLTTAFDDGDVGGAAALAHGLQASGCLRSKACSASW